MRVALLGFGVVSLALSACGGASSTGLFGAGSDAGEDAKATTHTGDSGGKTSTPGVDAGHDASSGDTPDVGVTQPQPDATQPAPDAGAPTPDATTPVDTGTTTGPTIQCLNGPCSGSTPVCCITASQSGESGACVAAASNCTGIGKVPVTCESNADCTTSQVCCAMLVNYAGQEYPTSLSCQSSCDGNNEGEVCDPTGTNICASGKTCTAFMGTPIGACETQNGGGQGGQGGNPGH